MSLSGQGSFVKRLKISVLSILAIFSFVLCVPDNALAAKSGGRASGNYRQSAPSRESRQSSRRTTTSESAFGGRNTIIIAPSPPVVFSPFGYSPFGVFSPVVSSPSLGTLVTVGVVGYVGYKVLDGIQNGDRDGYVEEQTVAKLQLALYSEDRSPSSILGTISRLVERTDTASQESMASLVGDVALALLRRESSWVSGSLETATFGSIRAADEAFGQNSLKERAKIERETVNRVNGRDRSEGRETLAAAGAAAGKGSGPGSTLAVVTLLVCLDGKEVPKGKDREGMRAALTALGSDLLSDNRLMSAEVMWTPEEADDVLLPQDLALDFPSLMPF